jgi:hypothetical protein
MVSVCPSLSLPLVLAVYIAALAAYAWYIILLHDVLQVLLYATCKRQIVKVHPCAGTEALYRPYSPQGE